MTGEREQQGAQAQPAGHGPVDRLVRRVRIIPGSLVSQDFGIGRWPATKAGDPIDPDMEFDAEWNFNHWECRSDGYGRRTWLGESGGYGNGSISVHQQDGVEFVDLDKLSA